METSTFSIVDATSESLNFVELTNLGCTRTSHVGLLANQNTTLAPLIYGLPIHYHEFLHNCCDPDYNVCNFQILRRDLAIEQIIISDDKGIWPPLAKWNSKGRSKILEHDNRFKNLAEACSSPFSFHLAATKSLFPNKDSVTLCSTNLIRSIDKIVGTTGTMRTLLQLIGGRFSNTEGRVKTFYRLIDENGICWYQQRKANYQKDVIKFRNDYSISVDDAIDSVLATFDEMYNLEQNPSYVLKKRPRIVMDTAFYIVMDFILSGRVMVDTSQGGKATFVSYHLAGTDLMNYLIYDPKQSTMYKNQVAKLINIISNVYFTGMHLVLKLVKPVITIGHSQYSYVKNSNSIPSKEVYPGSILPLNVS